MMHPTPNLYYRPPFRFKLQKIGLPIISSKELEIRRQQPIAKPAPNKAKHVAADQKLGTAR
ncbi:MAG TPA: hypothetical protein DCE18_11880 [Syntrophobacteraceae bacterium]|nr:hypothetical protein [Syntrophobacteraceae bacterium]